MDKSFIVTFSITGEVRVMAENSDAAYQHVMEMTQRELADLGELEVFAPETDEDRERAWELFRERIARGRKDDDAIPY